MTVNSLSLNRTSILLFNCITGFSIVTKHHDQNLLTEEKVYFGLQRDKNLRWWGMFYTSRRLGVWNRKPRTYILNHKHAEESELEVLQDFLSESPPLVIYFL